MVDIIQPTEIRRLGMSDMLQLVVEIGKSQATILPVASHIESSLSQRQAESISDTPNLRINGAPLWS